MSLPTPPAGTLDKDQPWYRGKIGDAQWDRLKAKLTGGTDAGGTSYSKIIDCSSSEADKIISNMKKDPRGYPQINNPGGAEGYENMYNYYTFLKDAYLYDEPKPEPEQIPVEVEVVEVEQKTVDEPIVIKIEAPFEPTPEAPKLSAPKRVRLPRRSGVMKARPIGPAKKSSAERMSEAFDKNLLDPLVDGIQNPPAPAPPRQRKQKETLVKVKRSVRPKSRFKETNNVKPLENTSLFVFNKVKSAFGRAADARRMAQEQGLPEQEKRFYIKRALGFEFGGDAIARTRGTFSKSPDATLDPSLTKQQRYTQGLFGTRTIRPPAKTKDTSGNIDTITKKISDLEKQFDNLIEIKKVSSDSKESTGDLSKTLDDLKNALKKGSKYQKDINASKKKLLDLEAKAADAAQAGVEEAELDKTQDLSDFVKNAEKKEKEEEEGKSKDDGGDGGGGNWMRRMFRQGNKWLRRIKNPGRTLRAGGRLARARITRLLRRIPGGKNLSTKFQNVTNKFLRGKGTGGPTGATGAGATATGFGARLSGIASRLKGIKLPPGVARAGGFLRGLGGKALAPLMVLDAVNQFKKITNPNDNIFTALGDLGTATMGLFGGGDPFKTPFQDQRGDLSKMEEGSQEYIKYKANESFNRRILAKRQAADPERYNKEKDSVLEKRPYLRNHYDNPDPQNKLNLRPPDVSQYGDIPEGYELKKQDDGTWKMVKKDTEKMSKGGTVKLAGGGVNAMIGEAGPEMLLRAGEGGMNPLQSLAPIIASLREVTKRAGTWADPVENMVRQMTDPIAKSLKIPVVPMNVDIDKPSKSSKNKSKGFFDKLAAFFTGKGGEDEDEGGDGGDGGATTPSPVGSDAGGYKSLLDMIAGVESTSMGGYEAFNTGGSNGGHTAHGSGNSTKDAIGGSVKPLTQRTVAEVMQLQRAGHLHATGRYQIIQATLSGLMSGSYGETGVKPTDLYNAVTQDKLGIALIKGRLRTGANIQNFRNEWIGLHNVDDAKLQAAINGANSVYQANPNATAVAGSSAPPATSSPPPTAPVAAPSTSGSSSSGNNQMGRDAAKRRQDASRAASPAQPPTTPAAAPAPTSTGTVSLPLLFQQPAAAPQPAPNPLVLPSTSTGQIDWIEAARRQRLGQS